MLTSRYCKVRRKISLAWQNLDSARAARFGASKRSENLNLDVNNTTIFQPITFAAARHGTYSSNEIELQKMI